MVRMQHGHGKEELGHPNKKGYFADHFVFLPKLKSRRFVDKSCASNPFEAMVKSYVG